MMPRVLIVGTTPYRENGASRAFDSYFHGWDRDCLAQIFSNPDTPIQGHCGTLYQITDRRMLARWFRRDTQVGRIFRWEEMDGTTAELSSLDRTLYSAGSRKNSLIYLLRGLLWRRKFWQTAQLDAWLEDFQPECVFLSFSDDYFIPRIALYAAEKFGIPILSSIGDDYYFNYRFSLNPLYHLYKLSYQALIRQVFRQGGSAIYIDDKIRDKYNAAFGLRGRTVHLASEQPRRPFRPIGRENPSILYCGNLRLGRDKTLLAIASALGQMGCCLQVCSNEPDPRVYGPLAEHPSVRYLGKLPYSRVSDLTGEADLLILAEGFGRRDVDAVRYSLSTKAADAAASGAAVFACGHREAGAIGYCRRTGFAEVCTEPSQIEAQLRTLFMDGERQRQQYRAGEALMQRRHRLEFSENTFRQAVEDAILWT